MGILQKHFSEFLGEIKELGDVLSVIIRCLSTNCEGSCWCTCVNARCNTVSEVKLCRLCWRDRARACKSNGRPDGNPDESQWSSAEASITLPHKHTEEFKLTLEHCRFNKIANIHFKYLGSLRFFLYTLSSKSPIVKMIQDSDKSAERSGSYSRKSKL